MSNQSPKSLVEHFSNVTDPRVDRTKRHKLIDILVISICATISERLTTEFVEQAFLQGQARRGRGVSPLVHSDRGSQYASAAFRQKLEVWGCWQSMSRKGNCWDNAVTEAFFGILKNELVHHERFATRQEAKDKIFDYIEVFYNRSRIHSAADYFAPAEYEARYQARLNQAA